MTTTETPLERAAAAVRAYFGTRTDLPTGAIDEGHLELRAHRAREAAARRAIARAIYDGATAAQIALRAGVRQLLVAGLIDDEEERAQALRVARQDASRYLGDVREATKAAVLRSVGGGMTEKRAAELYGVDRGTVRAWLGKQPMNH